MIALTSVRKFKPTISSRHRAQTQHSTLQSQILTDLRLLHYYFDYQRNMECFTCQILVDGNIMRTRYLNVEILSTFSIQDDY